MSNCKPYIYYYLNKLVSKTLYFVIFVSLSTDWYHQFNNTTECYILYNLEQNGYLKYFNTSN